MKKRLLSTLLALCIALTLLPGTAWAETPTGGICGDAVRWTLKNGVLTISGTGAMDDYEYHEVPWVNQLDNITSVTIADGVTRIGEHAFSECSNLTDVAIPDSVAAIQSWAFADCGSLTNVSIPASVTTIGAFAFEKCHSLTDINVASGNSAYVSVDGVLFKADQTILHTYPAGKRGSYSIPASVTSIGDGAFHGASSLTNVTIPDGVTSIGGWAFTDCGSLDSITIPDSVTSIGYHAFSGVPWLEGLGNFAVANGIFFQYQGVGGDVAIPDGVTSIQSWAFADCDSLTQVTIPASVTTIGAYAFGRHGSLTGINVASGNSAYVSVDGVLFSADKTLLHTYPAGKTGSYSIPASVTSIGDEAFHGAVSLTDVIIPNGVTSIGRGAFTDCGSLVSITIPNSVDGIGSNAFSGTGLKTVSYTGTKEQWEAIPIGLNNEPLVSAEITYNPNPDDTSKPAPGDETLPDWYFLVAIFKNVDTDCDNGDGVATHTTYAMTQAEEEFIKKLAKTSEKYMNGLGVICAHLDFMEIDEPVTELAESEYGSWISEEQAAQLLKDTVDLDQYDHVFCAVSLNVGTRYSGLTGAAIENGTGHSCLNFMNEENTLGNFNPAFPGAIFIHEYLHFLELSMSHKWGGEFELHNIAEQINEPVVDEYKACYTDIILNQVGEDVRYGTGVPPAVWQYPPHVIRTTSKLTIPEGVATIDNLNFQSWPNLEQVTIPGSVTNIGYGAFQGCDRLKTVVISNGVTSIGGCAFADCSSLESVIIPSSVTSLGGSAFSSCSSLKNVTVSGSVTNIEAWTFADCGSLESVTISGGVTSIADSAFRDCGSLKSVTIPKSVTDIEYAAFWNTALTDVYYSGTEAQWNAIQFDEFNASLTEASVHYGSLMADVKTNDYYADAVAWALENSVTSGTGGSAFSPNEPCTRSQIVTFLWRVYSEQEPTITENPFTDVKPSDYYYKAVLWAVEKGITSGTGNGTTFSPSDVCTRDQAVTFLYRAAGSPAVTDGSSFTDVPKGEWYADAVAWAVANSITRGTGDGTTFSPNDTCTRAQIVTFLYRELGQ